MRDYYGYREYEYVGGVDGKAYTSTNYPASSGLTPDLTYGNQTGGTVYQYGLLFDIIGGLTNGQIGSTYTGHPIDESNLPNDPQAVWNGDDIILALETYDYWYSYIPFIPRSSSGSAEKEFFAECFDYNVSGYDVTPTQSVFGGAYEKYDDLIGEIYGGIS